MTREPPPTEEGWYAFHDLRRIDWDAWRDAGPGERDRVAADGTEVLERYEAVADAPEGGSAVYTVHGHAADLMLVHLRPTLAAIDRIERAFEQSAFAGYTERADSYVSVTEASGYSERAREYFEGSVAEDSGLAQYIRGRLYPTIPDEEFVCFYPMSKRRDPDQNWWDLPFEERAEHVQCHAEIGREFGGRVDQMITGSIGFEDWEWGVTLWTADLTDVKDLLTRMRFDPSTSRFAEFGPFHVGRRFPPGDLQAVLAGEAVPTDGGREAPSGAGGPAPGATAAGHGGPPTDRDGSASDPPTDHAGTASGTHDRQRGEDDGGTRDHGGPPTTGGEFTDDPDVDQRLATLGLSVGEDYDPGDFGLVYYSSAEAQALAGELEGLRENFEHYDRHVRTTVRAQGGRAAAVSVWTAREAAETAAGFLGDLPGIEERYGGVVGEADAGGSATRAGKDDGGVSAARSGEDDGGGSAARTGDDDSLRADLADADVYAGQPHGEDVAALVLFSEDDPEVLEGAVADLDREWADRPDHEKTAVYADRSAGPAAVVSIWATPEAAETVTERLEALPGVVGRPADEEGFVTMGLFYTVEPEYREEFHETFEEVTDLLADMAGHRKTSLLVNTAADTDMFIVSRWDSKADATAFFRSDAFRETVAWGREVLADRPRHVFLA